MSDELVDPLDLFDTVSQFEDDQANPSGPLMAFPAHGFGIPSSHSAVDQVANPVSFPCGDGDKIFVHNAMSFHQGRVTGDGVSQDWSPTSSV
ncbi:hypothetical protein [Streptomyces sp. 5-10]|uniref:hypothetical protein n=1 Tax=Streptomyces sp. 5-10 TaxID=878925 RepID=UPI001CC292EC|nr:hypothetical protein [Streptomyces sp. 5-10]